MEDPISIVDPIPKVDPNPIGAIPIVPRTMAFDTGQ